MNKRKNNDTPFWLIILMAVAATLISYALAPVLSQFRAGGAAWPAPTPIIIPLRPVTVEDLPGSTYVTTAYVEPGTYAVVTFAYETFEACATNRDGGMTFLTTDREVASKVCGDLLDR